MRWEVEYTDQFEEWYSSLTNEFELLAIEEGVTRLEAQGPTLGEPLAKRIKSSRHHNMKELRPLGETIRILFVFDPRRTAIMLLGGDKQGQWNRWYDENIPVADDLYDVYLDELREEGILQ